MSPDVVEDPTDTADLRDEARSLLWASLKDVEQHKTTALCGLGNALIAAATIGAVAPWDLDTTRSALVADAAHLAGVAALAIVGYIGLHVGKCLVAQPR